MIEMIVKGYLDNALDVPVLMEIPPKPPAKMVVIEKTGSSERNHINFATFAIQSYAPSLYEAAELNETIKERMMNMIDLDAISSVSLNSDYNFTDLANKRYRYQAVFDIVF